MANDKTKINEQLNSLVEFSSKYASGVLDAVVKDGSELKSGIENLSEKTGLVYDPQAVDNGLKTISKKMPNTPNGATPMEITKDVLGLENIPDPTETTLTINGENKSISEYMSDLFGSAETAPQKELSFESLGGESFKAIDDAISIGVAKVNGVINAIVESISDVNDSAATVLGGLTKELSFGGVDDLVTESGNLTRGLEVNDITRSIKYDPELSTMLGNTSAAASNYVDKVSKSPIKTGGGTVQDIAESLSRNTSTTLQTLGTQRLFTDDELSTIIQGARKDHNTPEYTEAYKTILANDETLTEEERKKVLSIEANTVTELELKISQQNIQIDDTGEKTTTIQRTLNNVDTTISGTTKKSTSDYFLTEKNLRKLSNDFEYIDSIEELSGEFKTMTRQITECIIHASDTYTNQNIGSVELDRTHKEDGFDGIQYHYVIRRDGRIQRGKPVNYESQASSINGHEKYAIDLCLVGGINVPTGTENPASYLSDKSYTVSQWRSLKLFLLAFYGRFPGGMVLGYDDIDGSTKEPYFDVIRYVRDAFGKTNLYTDTLTDQALSPSDITQKRVTEIF